MQNARANHADARIFMGDGGVDGGCKMPAPIMPTPASLWAMAVLITGRMPLLPTRVMSIADGTPIKPSSGMVSRCYPRG